MTPSPVINSSPVPSYASGYGGSFDDVLEKSFGDLSSHFSTFDSQSCGVQQTMSIYDNSLANAETESLYNAFGDRYHHDTHVSPTDLDLEFSAFMNSVPPQYVWFWGRNHIVFDPIARIPTRVLPTSHYCCLYYNPSPSRFLIWLLAFLTEFIDLALCYIRDPKSNDPLLPFLVFFVLFWSDPRATSALGSLVPHSVFIHVFPSRSNFGVAGLDNCFGPESVVHPNLSGPSSFLFNSWFICIQFVSFTSTFAFVNITCHVSFSCFYGSVLPCPISGVNP